MKISAFDLNLFVVLNAIYTEGSLTKAAEVVGITQPAVSNALARLRERFDDSSIIVSRLFLLSTLSIMSF